MSTPEPSAVSAGSDRYSATSPGRHSGGEDDALDILLAIRERTAPECPEDLLRQCYLVQRQFQFDRDEQLPLVHTRRLVETYVEREMEHTREQNTLEDA
jgi:hypothetical protein